MGNANLDFLSEHGKMAKLVDDQDWNSSPMGSMDTWSHALKTALVTISNSKLPTLVFWGNEFVVFYNDSFMEMLGSNNKEEFPFGQPLESNLKKNWEFIKPVLKNMLLSGNVARHKNQTLDIFSDTNTNAVLYAINYDPISESGKTVGITVTFTAALANEKNKSSKKSTQPRTRSAGDFYEIIAETSIPIAILRGSNHIIEIMNSAMFQVIFQKERCYWQGTPRDFSGHA
jgi:hypothetical protein